MNRIAISALAMSILSGVPASAGPGDAPSLDPFTPGGVRQQQTVRVRALADTDRISPGQTFHLAFVFDINPEWHVYWKNPGEGAAAPDVRVTAPEGFTLGELRWPRPITIESPIGDMFGYEDQFVLFLPVTAPPELMSEQVTFRAELGWAVCKDICRFERATSTIKLAASDTVNQAASTDPILDKHRKRLPEPLDELNDAGWTFDGEHLVIEGPAGEHERVMFYPARSPGIEYGEIEADVRSNRFRVRVPVTIEPHNALGEEMSFGGLIALGDELDDPSYEFQAPVPAGRGGVAPRRE